MAAIRHITRRGALHMARVAFIALALAQQPVPAAAQGTTVVERMLAQQNPCRALRVNMLGMAVAVDQLRGIEVTSLDLSIQGDNMIAEVVGRLSCAAGSGSMAQGDIQAAVRMFASLDLASCTTRTASVTLSEISGSFGEMVRGVQPDMEAVMAAELGRQLVRECQVATTLQ